MKNVTELGSGDISGKARLIRFMERTLDRRAGAADAVKGAGKGKGKDVDSDVDL